MSWKSLWQAIQYYWKYFPFLFSFKNIFSFFFFSVSFSPAKKTNFPSHLAFFTSLIWTTFIEIRVGAISSDLYRPQSQDEIVEFSFFVALSYESNLQLGCFWWKISTSSLKTFFYKFCAYFCKSHVQTWELRFSKIYMIEGWWVKKNALSHSHFHYW